MRLRNLTVDDAERVFDAFKSVQIIRGQESAPASGFYDYHLGVEDFRQRLDSPLSIALMDRGRLIGYVIGYTFGHVRDMDVEHDTALLQIEASPDTIYADQLFIARGLPLYLAGRLMDTWTRLAQEHTRRGVVCTISQRPWRNVSSTRLAVARGFKRELTVQEKELELGIFSKPLRSLGHRTTDLKIKLKQARK